MPTENHTYLQKSFDLYLKPNFVPINIKNLRNLIGAYISLDEGIRKGLKLLLVGFKGWRNVEIMQLLKKVKPDVVYLGYFSDKELGKLYSLAKLSVYPFI